MESVLMEIILIILYIVALLVISGLFYYLLDKLRTLIYNFIGKKTIDQRLDILSKEIGELKTPWDIQPKKLPSSGLGIACSTTIPQEQPESTDSLFKSCVNWCVERFKLAQSMKLRMGRHSQAGYASQFSKPLEYNVGTDPKTDEFLYPGLDMENQWKKLLSSDTH